MEEEFDEVKVNQLLDEIEVIYDNIKKIADDFKQSLKVTEM